MSWTVRAQQFEARPSSAILSSALASWREVLLNKQRAYLCAVEYDTQRYLVYWQIKLRQKIELVRRAKFARKYLLLCNAWKMWVHKLDEKKRLAKLQELESKLLSRYYISSYSYPYSDAHVLTVIRMAAYHS
jgi:protein SFI1